jgi:serine/threonine protein kinase
MFIKNLVLVLIVLFESHLLKNFEPKLQKFCRERSDILQSLSSSDEVKKQRAQNSLRLFDSMINKIKDNSEPVAIGCFAQVFKMYSPELKSTVAFKLQRIINDYSQPGGKKQQDALLNEIVSNKKLNKLDQEAFFFPQFATCFDVTDALTALFQDPLLPTQVKEVSHTKAGEAVIITVTELLDEEFFDVVRKQYEERNRLSIKNRLQIGLNLSIGLSKMNRAIFHCDIKPENIMLKTIPESDPSEVFNKYNMKGSYPFSKVHGIYKLPNFIDFGLSVEKNQLCNAGTPGYLPKEFYGPDHSKIDVFGLAMNLLSLEIASLNFMILSEFSSMRFTIHNLIYNKKLQNDYKLLQNETFKESYPQVIKKIEENEFLLNMKGFLESSPIIQELFAELLRTEYPGTFDFLVEHCDSLDKSNPVNLQDCLYVSITHTENMTFSFIHLIAKNLILKEKMSKVNTLFDGYIRFKDQLKVNAPEETLRELQLKINLDQIEKQSRQFPLQVEYDYLMLLLETVKADFSRRKSSQEFAISIHQLFSNFIETSNSLQQQSQKLYQDIRSGKNIVPEVDQQQISEQQMQESIDIFGPLLNENAKKIDLKKFDSFYDFDHFDGYFDPDIAQTSVPKHGPTNFLLI